MTGRNQTINDILSNKKLRDQNAYVEVFSQTALETLCLSLDTWVGGVVALQGCSLGTGLATGPQGLKPRNR